MIEPQHQIRRLFAVGALVAAATLAHPPVRRAFETLGADRGQLPGQPGVLVGNAGTSVPTPPTATSW